MPDTPLLSLENICFAYADRPPVFSDLCFFLNKNDQIGLQGPNGCGKTTLLRLVMGLEKPQQGRILFNGVSIDNAETLRNMRCSIGFVLQNSDDQLFLPSVLDDVAFGPLNLGLGRKQARERAMETLEAMGIANLADRLTHRLSGGEKKMVSIATVLSMRPQALLLDEPTTFLDSEAMGRIVETLQQQDIAKIIVSHDTQFLKQTTTSCLVVRDGKLARVSL